MKLKKIAQLDNSSMFGYNTLAGNRFSILIDCSIENLLLVFFESGSWVIEDLELNKRMAFFGEDII